MEETINNDIYMLREEVEKLKKQKICLEIALEQEQERIVNHLQRGSLSVPFPPRTTVTLDYNNGAQCLNESLKAEILFLRGRQSELEKELLFSQRKNEMYKKELIQFRKKNAMPIDDLVGTGEMVIPINNQRYLSSRPRFYTNRDAELYPIITPKRPGSRSNSLSRGTYSMSRYRCASSGSDINSDIYMDFDKSL